MTPDPRDRATGGMPFDEFLRAARKEKPYLVDPYVEDPEETPRRSGDRSEGSGRCQIRAMMAPDREYAAMARYFVQVEWRLDVTTAEEQVETPARQP